MRLISPMQSHGQPLKQKGGFPAVLCAVSFPISCTSSMACGLHYFTIFYFYFF